MEIFSNKETKNELVLVFNVGSSSVDGMLFWAQSSGVPKIIFSCQELIRVEEKVEIDHFLLSTIKSLEIVAQKIYRTGLGAPNRIFCVMSSPWYVFQTRIISYKKNTPFLFTPKLADELIKKEIKLFEEENASKFNKADKAVRIIELKSIKALLNGYETSEFINKKTKELEMTIFVSTSGEQMLKKTEEAIGKHFRFKRIEFSSAVLSFFTVVRDLYFKQENFLLVEIGGEVTDISLVKKNTLRESISFPIGRNFLTRGVASSMGCTLSQANSFISLLMDGHAEESLAKKLTLILNKLKAEWLKKFQDSLANLSKDISIPSTIFLTIDKDLADFFSETIKTEQYSQYSLTESKFEVIFFNTEQLQEVAMFNKDIIREPSLIIDAVYINRFLLKNNYD